MLENLRLFFEGSHEDTFKMRKFGYIYKTRGAQWDKKKEKKNRRQHWMCRLMPMLHQSTMRKSPAVLIPKAKCRLWMNGTRFIGGGLKMNKIYR